MYVPVPLSAVLAPPTFHAISRLYFVSIQFAEKKKLYYARKNTISSKILFFISSRSFTGGASYSPEYYINIRTGIHYFPKGNATIDPGSNRFKSGLNRIEEKLDEVGSNKSFSIICLEFFPFQMFVQLLM